MICEFPHADSNVGRGTERGGGAPVSGRYPRPATLSGAASIRPCVPQPGWSGLLHVEHPCTASAHPVPLPQVHMAVKTVRIMLFFNIFFIMNSSKCQTLHVNSFTYLCSTSRLCSSGECWSFLIMAPQQCLSWSGAPGPGEEGLFSVSALLALLPRHPGSRHLCLP